MHSARTPEVFSVSLTFVPTSMRARRVFAFIASALALAIGFSAISAAATFESAAAAGTNPLGPLKGFTVVTQGDATFGNSGEIEGSLAVGGNLAFQQYNLAPNQDGSALPIVDGQSNVGLFVGGTVTFPGNGKFDINGGGVARITGTSGMSVSADQRLYAGANQQAYVKSQVGTQTTVASYTATAGAYAAAFPSSTFATLASTSSSYAAITSTGGDYAVVGALGNPGGEPVLTLTAGKINIWNVSSTLLAGKTAFQFANGVTPSATTPLVINVTDGNGGTMNAVRVGDKTTAPYVLWNFSGWTALEITGSAQLNGAILAPSAAVKNSNGSETNGQIVAKSFVSNTAAEIHHYGFNYTTPEKTVVAGSWSTTTECASPSNQLIVNAATGITYTWVTGGTGTFTSFSQSNLTGKYKFTVSVSDASLYTLGSNATSFEVVFKGSKDCTPPELKCIPPKLVTYTYDEAINGGTITIPSNLAGYSNTLCKPFWVTAVAWKYTKNSTWPQAWDFENFMSNNEGGYTITKSGTYTYGATPGCGQGDVYASFVSQSETSPALQDIDHLNGPQTPFKEYFLHAMGFDGPTPTYMQSPLGCNKATPIPATGTASKVCDIPGSVTVGPDGATVVLTAAAPIAKIAGVVYSLTKGDGASGAWEVTATPDTYRYFDGVQKVVYSGDLGTTSTCDTAEKPTLTDAVCAKATGVVTNAYIVIPSGTNFVYKRNGLALTEGEKIDLLPNTTTVIAVEAKPGYTNVGDTSFTFIQGPVSCDKPADYVAPTFTDQVCVKATGSVTGATLEFTRADHVTFQVDGVAVVFPAGENTVTVPVEAGTRVVTFTADSGYFLAGTANLSSKDVEYKVTAPATCDKPVDYVAPKVTDEVCTKATGVVSGSFLTFTKTANLTYFVDGVEVVFPAGDESVDVAVKPGTRVVTAEAASGYFISGTTVKSKDYDVVVAAAGTCDKPVEYVKPDVETEVCDTVDGGVADGSVTFTKIPAHLTYVFNGAPVKQGDSFELSKGDYQLVVTAEDGYFITGADSEETYTITVGAPATDCDDLTTIPTDPFASPQECVANPVVGGPEVTDGTITIVYAQHVTWEISDDADGIRHAVTVTPTGNVVGHAGWNRFVYAPGQYHVWATADAGHFLHATPSSTVPVTEVSFANVVKKPTFNCQLPDHADLPAEASWTNQVCSTGGLIDPTVTIVPSVGVTYFLDGKALTQTVTTVKPGTYVLTAEADDPDNTVSQTWPPLVLTAAASALCGDLTTLALTGETPGGWLIAAVLLLQVGLALVAVQFIRARRKARHLAS